MTGVLALQDDASDLVIEMHSISTDVMIGLILLHIIGVLVSSFLYRENLVVSMITGVKPADTGEGIQRAYKWLGVLMVTAVVVFWFLCQETASSLSDLKNRSENSAERGQILSILQVNSRSIDQKSGEICTAQTDLQPISFKSDRLLG